MYLYRGFGLHIASTVILPELWPANFLEADVTITEGKIPQLNGPGVHEQFFAANTDSEYTLKVTGVARYYAGHGKRIIVEPAPRADGHSINLFLLSSVMAAILYQRRVLPLQAAAVVHQNKLILLAGSSGAGKSTMLAQLAQRGYVPYADDICPLHFAADGATIMAAPAYPVIKLWQDSVAASGNGFNPDYQVRPQLPQFGQYMHHQFAQQPMPVAKVLLISAHPSVREWQADNLTPVTAFRKLERLAYRYRLIGGGQLPRMHFTLTSALVNLGQPVEVKRPVTPKLDMKEFTDFVEGLL